MHCPIVYWPFDRYYMLASPKVVETRNKLTFMNGCRRRCTTLPLVTTLWGVWGGSLRMWILRAEGGGTWGLRVVEGWRKGWSARAKGGERVELGLIRVKLRVKRGVKKGWRKGWNEEGEMKRMNEEGEMKRSEMKKGEKGELNKGWHEEGEMKRVKWRGWNEKGEMKKGEWIGWNEEGQTK